jgi:menaquinone-dependent protoporphyrinogen oxidase
MLRFKEETLSSSVLVAYATHYGSTQEVAEAVAATLPERGLEVELQPMMEVRGLDRYGAVVRGTAIYMFRLHKDARRFLTRHREALARRPAAIFALGPFNGEEKEWQGVRAQPDKELAQFPWFTPVVREVFGGKFDPAKLRFPYNLVPYLKRLPASDIRHWKAIRAWATNLAERFQRASPWPPGSPYWLPCGQLRDGAVLTRMRVASNGSQTYAAQRHRRPEWKFRLTNQLCWMRRLKNLRLRRKPSMAASRRSQTLAPAAPGIEF